MNLPPRTLTLKKLVPKDHPVLALDTGFEPDSLEGLRLVKASRGSGWVYHRGALRPWVTKGVVQEDKRLVVWGDTDPVPEAGPSGEWPREGEEGRAFLRAFVEAWTARAGVSDPLAPFASSSVVPFRTPDGWAFAFPPSDLQGVLGSLQPLGERLAWDHFRHPDLPGPASWAFASAALGVDGLAGALPWAQDDEAHLRQEIRDLKRTFSEDELPEGTGFKTRRLWFDSLTGRTGTNLVDRWKAWAAESADEQPVPTDPVRDKRREAARARRERRRGGAAFWRRKGTLVTAVAGVAALVLLIVGSVIWGIVKPDPTDTWTPEQVVRGYYQGIDALDSEALRKLTSFDKGKEPDLGRDQEEVTNLYVIRQVRTAYEKQSPMVAASAWEAAGRPALTLGQFLYGTSDVTVEGAGDSWTVRYHRWTSEAAGEGQAQKALGASVADQVTLVKTWKGWKISSLRRQTQPLP
jgi:hypothetical protein